MRCDLVKAFTAAVGFGAGPDVASVVTGKGNTKPQEDVLVADAVDGDPAAATSATAAHVSTATAILIRRPGCRIEFNMQVSDALVHCEGSKCRDYVL